MQTNQETALFEQEMKKRGVPGNPKVFHTEQYGHKLVIVCFGKCLDLLQEDGLKEVIDHAARTAIGSGEDLSNLKGPSILEQTFIGEGQTIEIMTIITKHGVHGKTQFSIGLTDEMQIQAEVIRGRWLVKPGGEGLLKDGQNRTKS